MAQRHAIFKNGREAVMTLASREAAVEAYYDLGAYLDEAPEPGDSFEVHPVDRENRPCGPGS